MMASHSSADMLTSMRSRRMPALLTRTWRSPKVVDRLVDHALCAVPVRDVVEVGDGLTAGRRDLVHHLLGGRGVRAAAVGRAAEVVHHHLGAFGGEEQGVLAADAPSGSGDDRHAASSAHSCLCHLSCERVGRTTRCAAAPPACRAAPDVLQTDVSELGIRTGSHHGDRRRRNGSRRNGSAGGNEITQATEDGNEEAPVFRGDLKGTEDLFDLADPQPKYPRSSTWVA